MNKKAIILLLKNQYFTSVMPVNIEFQGIFPGKILVV